MRIIQVRDVQEALGVEDGEQQVIVGLKELLQLSWDQSRLFANNQNTSVHTINRRQDMEIKAVLLMHHLFEIDFHPILARSSIGCRDG